MRMSGCLRVFVRVHVCVRLYARMFVCATHYRTNGAICLTFIFNCSLILCVPGHG